MNHAKHNKLKIGPFQPSISNIVISLVGRFFLVVKYNVLGSELIEFSSSVFFIDAIVMVWSIHCVCSPGGRAVPPLFLQEVLASVYQWHTESRFLFLSFSFAVLPFVFLSIFFLHLFTTIILCTLNLFFRWLTANFFLNSSILRYPLWVFLCHCVCVWKNSWLITRTSYMNRRLWWLIDWILNHNTRYPSCEEETLGMCLHGTFYKSAAYFIIFENPPLLYSLEKSLFSPLKNDYFLKLGDSICFFFATCCLKWQINEINILVNDLRGKL
jgi:hypothetical protein